jgi:hypothetical protein
MDTKDTLTSINLRIIENKYFYRYYGYVSINTFKDTMDTEILTVRIR